MVKIGHYKGFFRRMNVLAVSLIVVVAGVSIVAWGAGRSAMENSGGGPIVERNRVGTGELFPAGNGMILAQSGSVRVFDEDGRPLHLLSGDFNNFWPKNTLITSGYAFVEGGVWDVARGEVYEIDWPNGFKPQGASWPYVYGANESNIMRISFDESMSFEIDQMGWEEGLPVIWNASRFMAVSDDRAVVEIYTEGDDRNEFVSELLIWDLRRDKAESLSMPESHQLVESDIFGMGAPIALSPWGVFTLTETTFNQVLSYYSSGGSPLWWLDLDSSWDHTSVSVGDGFWVLNFARNGEAVGFSYGDFSGNVIGHKISDLRSSDMRAFSPAWAVGDHIVFVENSRLVITEPLGGLTSLTWFLLVFGFLIIALGASVFWMRKKIISYGERRGIRCSECGSRFQDGSRGFCLDCGREAPQWKVVEEDRPA